MDLKFFAPLLLTVLLTCSLVPSSFAVSGIYESYAILSLNGGANTYYDMQATTGNPDFEGFDLGDFNSTHSLVVKGGQNKTFKCDGCDITNSTLFYRVWLTSGGASGSFNSISYSFVSNDAGGCGGNQTWEGTSGINNILSGLTVAGNYTLEVYSAADFTSCGSGTNFSNNGGANYKATFTFCGPAPTGDAVQSFCTTSTVADLTATGSGIQWYLTASGGSPLDPGTTLLHNTHYYASQTVDGCESVLRLDVLVSKKCPNPTAPNTSGITDVSATLNWTGTPLCATGVYIEYREVISPPVAWTVIEVNMVSTSYELVGLTDGTNYQWRVKNKCLYDGLPIASGYASPVQYFNTLYPAYPDVDLDGYGDALAPSELIATFPQAGYSDNNLDCDDTNADVNPLEAELCNGIDDDCDMNIDEPSDWYEDSDLDGLGNSLSTQSSCPQPPGYVSNSLDCDDNNNAAICSNPGGITVTDLETTSVTVNWDALPCASSYNLMYRLNDPGAPFSPIQTLTGNTAAITGLQPMTSYQLRLRSRCPSPNPAGISSWVYYTFFTLPEAPTGSATQTLCAPATVADLMATGSNIKWYDMATGGTEYAPAEILIDGNHYFASQTVNSLESKERFEVTVTVHPVTDAPTGDLVQIFCLTSTVSDLVATGTDIQWYLSASGGSPLDPGETLTHNNYYYATQTLNGCESANRLEVLVNKKCTNPVYAGTDDITLVSATLNWSASGLCGVGFIIEYREITAPPSLWVADTVMSLATTYSLTGLTTGKYYQWRVKNVCQYDGLDISSGYAAPIQVFNTLFTVYTDADMDGFGDSNATESYIPVFPQAGYSLNNTDCDDSNLAIYPGGTELCNGVDDDCDDTIDEPVFWYQDSDNDGLGDAAVSQNVCAQPVGYVGNSLDCDDENNGAICLPPSGVVEGSITNTSATIEWTPLACASGYNLMYRLNSPSAPFSPIFTTSGSSLTLTGLSPDTDYQYRIRSKCPSPNPDATSDWVYYTFSTLTMMGLTEDTDQQYSNIGLTNFSFEIYPNPGSGIFNIRLASELEDKVGIRVLDGYGQQVLVTEWTLSAGITDDRLDLSHLASGVYHVLVQQKGSVQSEKIVIVK